MSTNEIVDAVLRLLGILISWPLVVLVVVIIARRQLPTLIVDLSRRVRKAPGGFEFDQLKEQVDTVAEKVKHIEEVVTFRPSAALTPDLKQNIQKTLSGFYEHFKTVGFKPDTGRPEVEIRSNFENGNAHYYSSENRIVIDKRMAADPDVALREYTPRARLHCARTDPGAGTFIPCDRVEVGRLLSVQLHRQCDDGGRVRQTTK